MVKGRVSDGVPERSRTFSTFLAISSAAWVIAASPLSHAVVMVWLSSKTTISHWKSSRLAEESESKLLVSVSAAWWRVKVKRCTPRME